MQKWKNSIEKKFFAALYVPLEIDQLSPGKLSHTIVNKVDFTRLNFMADFIAYN